MKLITLFQLLAVKVNKELRFYNMFYFLIINTWRYKKKAIIIIMVVVPGHFAEASAYKKTPTLSCGKAVNYLV